jgi:TonB family protein
VRMLIPLALAIPAPLALFLIMPMLISVGSGVTPTDPMRGFVLAQVRIEEQPDTSPPEEMPEPPSGMDGPPTIDASNVESPFERPPTNAGMPAVGPTTTIVAAGWRDLRDCDHGPMAVATPVKGYPMAAARAGVEGWVRVVFTVSAGGGVQDVTVLAAEPRHSFERHAVESVSRWRFRPAMADCQAIGSRLEQRVVYTLGD